MTHALAVSILVLALGQAPPEEPAAPGSTPASSPDADPGPAPAPPAAPAARLVEAPPPPATVPAGGTYPIPAHGAPALRWGEPARCLVKDGHRWRAQCDPAAGRCLVAPDAELAEDGTWRAPLERARACVGPPLQEADLAARGLALVPAIAESPPGWRRDGRNRVMQVSFDLARRAWVGAGYAGGNLAGAPGGQVTTGIRVDAPWRVFGDAAVVRLRGLEGTLAFDGDLAEMLIFGVDVAKDYPLPLLRLSTFAGRPRRFDLPLQLGFGADLLRAETLHLPGRHWYDRVSGSAYLTADLWRSRDLSSWVRLRGGAGVETVDQWRGTDWTPQGGLDADLVFDRNGYHHARALALAEWILPTGSDRPPAPLPGHRRRLTLKGEYEAVLLAVNDQPVSLVLDVRGQSRDDVPALPTGWRVQGTASLRVNLWAPARRGAAVQDAL